MQGKEAGAGWDLARLQVYLAWAKGFRPQMTPEAESILLRYYQLQRKAGDRVAARTTIRMLESLVRLAQVRTPSAMPAAEHELPWAENFLGCQATQLAAAFFPLSARRLACRHMRGSWLRVR